MTDIHHPRPGYASQHDRNAAKAFEAEVGTWLGEYKIERLDSKTETDFWVPGFYVEVKEKRQPLSDVWPLPAGCLSEDAFILDELSVRRLCEKFPYAWFVLRDVPGDRIFLASIAEIVCGDHVRLNRIGSTDHKKGKWVIDLSQYALLQHPSDVLPTILDNCVTLPHRQSACLVPTEKGT